MAKKSETFLQVRVSKATEVVWEGKARSVSSENAQGPFDILPMHANFITLIKNKPILIIDQVGNRVVEQFPISVLYVYEDIVKVFTDITHISS